MKQTKWISALVLLFVPLIASAQLEQTEHIAAQIPFEFTVGNVTVPAGEVSLQLADQQGWVLAICNPSVKLSTYAPALPSEARRPATKSALVFRKYGDRYFLASMRIGDSRAVYEFRPGKLENEIRAKNIPATEEVLVASLR